MIAVSGGVRELNPMVLHEALEPHGTQLAAPAAPHQSAAARAAGRTYSTMIVWTSSAVSEDFECTHDSTSSVMFA